MPTVLTFARRAGLWNYSISVSKTQSSTPSCPYKLLTQEHRPTFRPNMSDANPAIRRLPIRGCLPTDTSLVENCGVRNYYAMFKVKNASTAVKIHNSHSSAASKALAAALTATTLIPLLHLPPMKTTAAEPADESNARSHSPDAAKRKAAATNAGAERSRAAARAEHSAWMTKTASAKIANHTTVSM